MNRDVVVGVETSRDGLRCHAECSYRRMWEGEMACWLSGRTKESA